jgi:hypothetical protein
MQWTLGRVDADGGSMDDMNWLLAGGYQVHGKDYSACRAPRLFTHVLYWVDDPKVGGWQVGCVRLLASEYVCPVRRLAVRCCKRNGQWGSHPDLDALSRRGYSFDPAFGSVQHRSGNCPASLRVLVQLVWRRCGDVVQRQQAELG